MTNKKQSTKTIINLETGEIQKQYIFKTQYNSTPYAGSINNDPSMTIQGDNYTIAELLAKVNMGQMIDVARNPQYSGTDDFDNYDPTLDPDFGLSEIAEHEAIQTKRNSKTQKIAVSDITEQKDSEGEPDKGGDNQASQKAKVEPPLNGVADV
ncbi:MAG: hypothetical protein [Microviridae sp.]|nr:MAG: hypothetical protein [Microviridae sp.]